MSGVSVLDINIAHAEHSILELRERRAPINIILTFLHAPVLFRLAEYLCCDCMTIGLILTLQPQDLLSLCVQQTPSLEFESREQSQGSANSSYELSTIMDVSSTTWKSTLCSASVGDAAVKLSAPALYPHLRAQAFILYSSGIIRSHE